MGADIHLHVEIRKHGTFSIPDRPDCPHPWEQIHRRIEIPGLHDTRTIDLGWGDSRNYDVFAMLADVRNGHGFAGIDTGEGFTPIAPPRGLPEDASSTVLEESESWGVDGHSHSFFTLRELLDLETTGYWDNITVHRGAMDREQFEENVTAGNVHSVVKVQGSKSTYESVPGNHALLDRRPVNGYSGSIHGPDPDDLFSIEWAETYRDSASWLLSRTIPALVEVASSYNTSHLFRPGDGSRFYPTLLAKDGTDHDHWVDAAELIRIVFWFDN
jgi:hypothetical protein